MMRGTITRLVLVVGGCIVASFAAEAHDLVVCAYGCQYSTVQSAVDSARSGDTIRIGSGTYFENVLIDQKSLMLVGAGEDKTTIDGRFRAPVFMIGTPGEGVDLSKSVTLVGMTITHGRGTTGGGIAVSAETLKIQYSIVASNSATVSGGGIGLQTDLSASMTHTVITHNRAPVGGGIKVDAESVMLISDSTVARNTADLQGGGLQLDEAASVAVTGTTFSDNAARVDGGGIYVSNGIPAPGLSLTNSSIVENIAARDGGGIFSRGRVVSDHTVIARNSAGRRGGGIGAFVGDRRVSVQLNDNFVIQNTAGTRGGGIFSDQYTPQALSITSTTIQDNQPDECNAVSGCP